MDPTGERALLTTERYTSPEFLEREKQLVFQKTWIVVARESDVGRAGDCLAIDEMDEAFFLVRAEDGGVRAFRNTCRHRGTRLLSGTCKVPRIRCPYHGWTYALDGRLIDVPKREGFDDLGDDSHGLVAIRSECWGGFVWITFSAGAPPVREYLGRLGDQLEPYRLVDMRPLFRRSWTLPCNWKAVLDQATESYHLGAVHPRLSRVVDAALTCDSLDLHLLQTVPMGNHAFRRWLDRLSTPGDLSFAADQLNRFHKYVVFPNTLLNVMPYQLTVFRVFPITPDTCRFHYEFHVREHAGAVGRVRGWFTLLASLYILREDLRLLPSFQAGVKAAGRHSIAFHREEQALEHFHRVLDRYAQGNQTASTRTEINRQ